MAIENIKIIAAYQKPNNGSRYLKIQGEVNGVQQELTESMLISELGVQQSIGLTVPGNPSNQQFVLDGEVDPVAAGLNSVAGVWHLIDDSESPGDFGSTTFSSEVTYHNTGFEKVIDITVIDIVDYAGDFASATQLYPAPPSFDLSSQPNTWSYSFTADPGSELKIQDQNGNYMTKDDVASLIAGSGDPSHDRLEVGLNTTDNQGQAVIILVYLEGAAGDPDEILLAPPAGAGPQSPMMGGIASAIPKQMPSGPVNVFSTLDSGFDGAANDPASVRPLDDNSEDGIIGHLHDLGDGAICDSFIADLSDEQTLLDEMVALINMDNGADAQFAESITDAMEDYIESAHPALVQSMLGMIEMLHNSNEELVEWSILKQMRDLVELRRQELDTCLDDQKTIGLDKVLSRLFAQVDGVQVGESDLVASPLPAGGPVKEGDGSNGFNAGQFFVDVNHPDGEGGYIAAKIEVTAMRKALMNLAAKRTAAGLAFDSARDAAAVQWSEEFKTEFIFEYDSTRSANAQDVAFDNTITLPATLGQDAVYAIASDTTDDVASGDLEYDTAGSTDDDYPTGTDTLMTFDAAGVEQLPRIAVGQPIPAGRFDGSGTPLPAKIFGGGFDELREQILIKHSLKEVAGNLVER